MKVCSIPICQDTFISKKCEDKNYSCNEKLYIGKCNEEEYRTILKFNISKNNIKGRIKKVELSLYLLDVAMDENTKCFMLNIARNIEPVDVREVSYSDAPEFCQQCEIYKIEKCFKKNYLKLDITKIAKSWIKGKGKNFGITLLGLYEDSFMTLYSSNGRKVSHVNIYIEEDENTCIPPKVDENPSKKYCENILQEINENNEQDNKIQYKINKKDEFNNVREKVYKKQYKENSRLDYKNEYMDNFNKDEVERIIEEKVQKEMEKEIANKYNVEEDSKTYNWNTEIIDKDKVLEDNKGYGYFYNDDGNIFKCNVGTAIIFNGYSNTKNMGLCDCNTGIMIKKSGVYKIDYGVNCRCDSIDTMQIEVKGELIPHTNIQVGLCESIIWGHTILNIKEDNTIIKLRLLSVKTLLMIIGVAAAVNIVRID